MSTSTPLGSQAEIVYPESDGKPIADNTKQFRYIVMIEGGLDALFDDNPNVFVAGDLLWYPVEGKPSIFTAPDAMVVFGRPKGDRRSYLQWQEGNIPPQVSAPNILPCNSVHWASTLTHSSRDQGSGIRDRGQDIATLLDYSRRK